LKALVAAALLLSAAPPLAAAPPGGDPPGAASLGARTEACFACHGESGRSTAPLTPSLGGQPSFFVVAQLFLFREGRRPDADPAMSEVAKSLTDDDLRAFGESISRLPPPPLSAQPPDAERYRRADAVARENHCPACHGADYSGHAQVPRLAGQHEQYLLKVMRDYRSGRRIGYGGAMADELKSLNDAQLADLAHFLAHFRSR
jgi:cytochrome c553